MGNTKIDWCTKVWNPVTGCTPVSAGCANCYAARMHGRFSDRPFSEIVVHIDRLNEPLRWRKQQVVFVCSMGDLFHKDVPFGDIENVMDVIRKCPQHTFIVLTKRPERMREYWNWRQEEYLNQCTVSRPPFNLWQGVSVEDQPSADERVPLLLSTPAAKRIVSVEPMIGAVDLASAAGVTYWDDPSAGLSWVICGGESGPGARPMHPDWARSLRDQCKAAGVPFWFKQWGEWAPSKMLHEIGVAPGASSHPWGLCQPSMTSCGKRAAGDTLDGERIKERP